MKLLQINATCGNGSTGKICVAVSRLLTEKHIENRILYSQGHSNYELGVPYSYDRYKKFQALKSRCLGNYGFNSQLATRRLIKKIGEFKPDIVHLHNIHAHDCNLSTLFSYFKENNAKLFWTFHDCWAFTGYCPHFAMVKCDGWRNGCGNCPQRRYYSWFFDRSRTMFERKRKLFSGLNLTIVTPSNWLAGLVKESFLKDYPVRVINNGVDLSVFKPTPSDARQKLGITDEQFVVLGVALYWDERKGLDAFVELARRLPSNYRFVLVGTDANVEKRLPSAIIAIRRTQNQRELAEIYSTANVFFNPTREENYPTVNMESIACGTPVVTFRTGGSPEILDERSGIVVERDNLDAAKEAIRNVCENNLFRSSDLTKRASTFDQNERFNEYINLYDF